MNKNLYSLGLMSGTSVGGIVLSVAAKGECSARRAIDEIEEKIPLIFSKSWIRTFTSINGIASAKYARDGLDETLDTLFGETALKDVRAKLIMTSVAKKEVRNGHYSSSFPALFTSYKNDHRCERPYFTDDLTALKYSQFDNTTLKKLIFESYVNNFISLFLMNNFADSLIFSKFSSLVTPKATST